MPRVILGFQERADLASPDILDAPPATRELSHPLPTLKPVGNLIVALRQDLLWWYLAIAAVIGLLTGLRNAFRSARQADRWDEPTFGWAMLQLLLSLVQALGWPLAPAVWLVVRRAKRARERRLAAEESARRERVIDALLHEVQ